jgi:ABC-type branched-subunit amino acid transport system ATPase component
VSVFAAKGAEMPRGDATIREIAPAHGNALEVDGLTVRFGQTEVLKNLSFALEKGKALAIIRPNWAGKTVLFQTLIGALSAEGASRAPFVGQGIPESATFRRNSTSSATYRSLRWISCVRYLGVLLMGALIIVPSATAKRLAGNLTGMLAPAAVIAVAATAAGNGLAVWLHRQTAPFDRARRRRLFLAYFSMG